MKKKEEVHWSMLEANEKMKYEIAQEIGLLDKVLEVGWKNLTAKETGRIGGLVTKRKKTKKNEQNIQNN